MSKTGQLILVLFLLLALLAAGLLSGLIDSNRWRIQKLDVEAPFKRVSAEQIRRALAASPERSFFRLDVQALRQRLQKLDWVDRVSVVKKWPDTLQIRLFEHEPVAIWNDNRLLNRSGQVFAVADVEALSDLPSLHGRDVTAATLWDQYQRFNNLLQATGTDIQSVTVSDRGAWAMRLRNGMKVYAGSRQLDARLGRLADSWEALMQLGRGVPEYVDLRYPNGYASKWAQPQPAIRESNDTGSASRLTPQQVNG
jgi:cell division protein FtsQ